MRSRECLEVMVRDSLSEARSKSQGLGGRIGTKCLEVQPPRRWKKRGPRRPHNSSPECTYLQTCAANICDARFRRRSDRNSGVEFRRCDSMPFYFLSSPALCPSLQYSPTMHTT